MNIQIEYLADHLNHVDELARLHYAEWSHLSPQVSLQDRTERLTQIAGRGAIPVVFVAIHDQELIGSAALVKYDLQTRKDLSPWLAAVYVKAEYRQNGVATQLVSRVESEAVLLGVKQLYLYTEHQADFYARRGWETMEQTYYHGAEVVVMKKELL